MGAANAGAAYVYAPASLRLGKNWVSGCGFVHPPPLTYKLQAYLLSKLFPIVGDRICLFPLLVFNWAICLSYTFADGACML